MKSENIFINWKSQNIEDKKQDLLNQSESSITR